MSGTIRCAVAVAIFLACSTTAWGQVRLTSDWDEAFKEAERRNVPVLVALGKEGKAPWVSNFQNKQLATYLNDRVIVVVGHYATKKGHKPAKRIDRKTRKQVEYCPLYPSIVCKAHETIMNDRAGLYDYETLPAGFLVGPDKKVRVDKIERMGVGALPKKIDEVQAKLGEGVFNSEILRLERKLRKGDKKLKDGKLKAARKVYEKQLKTKRLKAFLKKTIEERLVRLDAKAREMIKEAVAAKKPDHLKRIAREMRGREPSDEAKQALSTLSGK